MNRRTILKGAAHVAALSFARAQDSQRKQLVLLTTEEAASLKSVPRLSKMSETAITAGPFSVTFHRPSGSLTGAGPNDFFSEGPYWWPNPDNPGGPYIRRDGVVNPGRFIENDRDLGLMSDAVLTLALSAFIEKDEAAARRAWRLARVWFADDKTRMNPNLEFGQAIRGVTTGRGIGIIDTVSLIWCAQGLALLEASFNDRAVSEAARGWFASYTDWLVNSKKGKDEAANGNNHSTWYAAQVAAYSLYCGDSGQAGKMFDLHENYLIPSQLKPDGSAPHEEARTRSLSYSLMNLNGFALLCRMAKRQGRELWRFKTPQGAGVLNSIEYLLPFLKDPSKWTKPQITPLGAGRGYVVGLAGLDCGREDWIEFQRAQQPGSGASGALIEMILRG